MRKNKKIIAILTLVLFAMSMLPVAAFAADSVTVTPPVQAVDGDNEATVTIAVTGAVENELFVRDANGVVVAGPLNVTDPASVSANVTAPAATASAQIFEYFVVEAADATAAATAAPITGGVFNVNVKAAPTVAFVEPPVIGEDKVIVTFTGAETGDTISVFAPNGAKVIDAEPVGATPQTIPTTTEIVNGEYRVVLTNASDAVAPNTVEATSFAQQEPLAPGEPVSDASIIEVVDKNVDVNESSTTEIALRDQNGRRATVVPQTIFVWAEERVGQPTSALTKVVNDLETDVEAVNVGNNVYSISVSDSATLELTYSRAGQYSVYASLANPNIELDQDNRNYDENAAYGNVAVFKSTSRVVTVEGDKADVVAIGVDSVNSPNNEEVVLLDGGVYGTVYGDNFSLAYVWRSGELVHFTNENLRPIYVDPNGVSESDIDFVVYQYIDENNNGIIDGDEDRVGNIEPVDIGIDVTFDTNSNAIKVSRDKDTTDYNGEVDIAVTGTVEGEYKIYVKAGSVEITVPVEVAPLRADDIKVTKQPEGAIASGDYSTGCDFRFQILDPNGMVISNALTGDDNSVVLGVDGLNDELVQGPYGLVPRYDGKFVNLTAPNAADLDEDDVRINPRTINGERTGEYCVTFDKDLVAGDYTLEIILDNGRKASFNWTVKDFGTAKELKIEYPRNTVELGGTTAEPDIYFLDENGVKKDASRYVDLGASGYAIADFETETGVVTVENDEKYIGDTINVYAVAEREGLTAQATLTVTSGEGALTFDQNRGPVNFNNRVPFKVVDKDGNQLVLGADKQITSATVVVTKQSNPDAKISGNVATYSYNDILEKGTGILNLTSDKEGTAEVKVTLMVRDENTAGSAQDSYRTQVYSGTLDYTFGDASEFDGRIVVMVIGSADTIVDNKIVTIDAAPFVNADWRTMVPFRALAEDFGATVEWNEADQTVTAELDGVTLVMTIGSETYTVNGVEKTMDTAPVIVDGRTYVPVRFPAEAFGFDVVPTYNDEGLTSSVLFTK